MKLFLCLVAFALLAADASACGVAGARRSARIAARQVVSVTLSQPFYVVPQVPVPKPMAPPVVGNSAKDAEQDARLTELERRQAAAGRALLFGEGKPVGSVSVNPPSFVAARASKSVSRSRTVERGGPAITPVRAFFFPWVQVR